MLGSVVRKGKYFGTLLWL